MATERRIVRRFVSSAPEATEALGAALGGALAPGTVVALDGDLGSGKTCLVRGLARGLGVEGPVTSPTYALLQTYAGRLELHHFDAWMEGRERAFLLDGGDVSFGSDGVAVVEWAGRVAEFLPAPRLWIGLEHRGVDRRAITLAVEDEAGAHAAPGPAARALAELARSVPPIAGLADVP
jgi:tRNA threonylcarbamoyladenosine biosynthesis protein TsaE